MKTTEACLYLLPVPLFEDKQMATIAPVVKQQLASVGFCVAESLKMGKRWVKWAGGVPENVRFWELNEHGGSQFIPEILEQLKAGNDVVLISDAGCPALADPGAVLVDRAHKAGIRVVPHSGPSSIVMALMGCGFNTQRFAFMGYLPVDAGERKSMIRDMESRSAAWKEAIAFIETPYRNQALLDELLKQLKPGSQLSILLDVGAAGPAMLTSKTVAAWKKEMPRLDKVPAVYVIAAF